MQIWLLITTIFFAAEAKIIVFDPSNPKVYKSNFCPNSDAFLNFTKHVKSGTTIAADKLSPALRGQTVYIGVNSPSQSNPFYMKFDSEGNPIGGYMYQVHQQIASRGQFTVQYVQLPQFAGGNGTDYLGGATRFVDFYAAQPFADTTAARANGIGFTTKVAEASLVLVERTKVIVNDIWFWSLPFAPSLWALCLTLCFINGFIEFLIRNVDEEHEEGTGSEEANEEPHTLTDFMFYSFMTFSTTDPEAGRAKNDESRIVSLGVSFFCLVLTATYTAKLAEQIIEQNIPLEIISNIGTAKEKNSNLCVVKGSYADYVLKTSYPSIRRTYTNKPTYSLSHEYCDAAIMPVADWMIASRTSSLHPDCNLQQVGPFIRVVHGSMAFEPDYNMKCTTFANDVFTSILLLMYADNTLDTYFKNALNGIGNLSCPVVESPISLSIREMGGLFIVYAGFVSLALLLHVFDMIYIRLFPDSPHAKHVLKRHGSSLFVVSKNSKQLDFAAVATGPEAIAVAH